jgi:hypothetical protein
MNRIITYFVQLLGADHTRWNRDAVLHSVGDGEDLGKQVPQQDVMVEVWMGTGQSGARLMAGLAVARIPALLVVTAEDGR